MIRKLTLAAGFGAGYVLGAKAGTQRYEQIMGKVRELAGMPAVQDMTSTLADTASQIGDTAKSKVNETVTSVGEKVTGATTDVVDLGSSSGGTRSGTPRNGTRSGARTAAAPMPGATASASAPDV